MKLVNAACQVWSMGNRSTDVRERIAVDEVLRAVTVHLSTDEQETVRQWMRRFAPIESKECRETAAELRRR